MSVSPSGFAYKELNANATTQLKVGRGVLRGLMVIVPGGGTIRVRDDDGVALSGPYVIGGTAALAIPAAGTFIDLSATFLNGCQVIIATMTSGSVVAVWS